MSTRYLVLAAAMIAFAIFATKSFAAADSAGVPGVSAVDSAPASPTTTGETVNAMIDNLLATADRLLQLPMFALVGIIGAASGLAALAAGRLLRKRGKAAAGRGVGAVIGLTVIFFITILFDRKLANLQAEVNQLRSKSTSDAAALLAAVSERNDAPADRQESSASVPTVTPAVVKASSAGIDTSARAQGNTPATRPTPASGSLIAGIVQPVATTRPALVSDQRKSFLFDLDAAQQSLKPIFSDLTLKPLIYNQAMDIVRVHSSNPLSQAFLAVVDLHEPSVRLKIGGSLSTKTLTSQFAKDNQCTIAINGEAGLSPDPGSGLGTWRGNFMVGGQLIMREDAKVPRPFLAFDRDNHADFVAAAAADRAMNSQAFNIMWGRLDAVINGQVQMADERNRQPRTAMGINEDGGKLYLLVIDGRQPRYSMGFTRAEVGQTLKAFGAYNGMLCDEGGSSCIYIQQLGGIANIPSDNQGQERPTYTHFGIAIGK